MEKIKRVISIDLIREISGDTPFNKAVSEINSKIKEAASKFQNSVDIDLLYVGEVWKNFNKLTANPYTHQISLTDQQSFGLLPDYYQSAITAFKGEGYKISFHAKAWYNRAAYEEGYEFSFRVVFSW